MTPRDPTVEWKSSEFLKCKYCNFRTKDKGKMSFHLQIGHNLLDEFVKQHTK